MQTFAVPGMAVAIVRDGAAVVAKGYGVRRLGTPTPVDAQTLFGIELWRHHDNEVRPHSSLGYRTPLEFKATCVATFTEGRSPAMPARADQEEQRRRPEDATLINQPTGAILQ